MSTERPWRAEPKIATTRAEVLEAAQSKYTVVPNSALLSEAAHRGFNRLGIVGLPCHIHGIRKMQMSGKPKTVLSKIKFTIGIFCGSNQSHKTTEWLIAKGAGIPLERVEKFEYRAGLESQDIRVTTRDGKIKVIPKEIYTRAFSKMQRERCTVCWDFSAELADVSLGDIFLPIGNMKLPNLSAILTRTKQGEALVDGAEKNGYIRTFPLPESGFSSNVGIENKKHFAAFRLLERKRFGWPVPNYHYEIKYEPPTFTDKKAAILQQIKDVPEIIDWVLQNPIYKEQFAAVDPEILKVMKRLSSSKKR
jgi:coenzyme F420 hydrogenase subunit beta